MTKVKPHTISSKEKIETVNGLFEVVSRLKTKKEIVDFFLGLFTQSEALMIARRIQIAKLLLEDKSYEDIQKTLKVGSSTIQRTYQWLYGGDKKYNDWLQGKVQGAEVNKKYKNITYDSLLDKYPHHRFIKNLFK